MKTDKMENLTGIQAPVKRSCLTCRYFQSWESIYEDPLEPFDNGLCDNENSKHYKYTSNGSVGEDDICEHYKANNFA
jgi:hypothetical protein